MIHGLVPSLAEGGKIKIGGLGEARPTKDGKGTWRRPVKYDEFKITKTTRDAAGDLELDRPIMEALTKGKPEGFKLREIPIVLHSDVIEEIFPSSYAMYAGKKLNCRGDGQTATRFELDAKGNRTGKSKDIPCPCPYLNAKSGPVCKPHATLHCSINIPGLAVAGVVHKLRTTSIMTIQRMTASLMQIRELCGTLKGIPLILKVSAVPVTPNDAPPSTVYVCHVELRASDVLKVQQQALEVAENRRALGGNFALEYRKAVKSPGVGESPEEEKDIAEEFHSETDDNRVDETPADAGPQPNVELDDRGLPKGDPGAILDDEPEGSMTEEPCISIPQIRRLYTVLHGAKNTEEVLKAHLKDRYKVESTKDVKLSWYDEIVEWAGKKQPIPASAQGQKA